MAPNNPDTAPRVLMMGNEAAAEGAIRAGCQCYFGYPITPQNEITAYMSKHMPAHKRVFIQAESELAAINMVLGAAVTGARAMTSSSSPGISLKQEGISYISAMRLPALIINVQRGGPGLGSIDPSQGDYFQAVKGGGHGDYHIIVMAPCSVQEMHDFAVESFTLAETYRMPVMILADGRLGQMMESVTLYTGQPPPALPKPWALTGAVGREAQCVRSLFLYEGELAQHNAVLQADYRRVGNELHRSESTATEDCDLLVVSWGTSARIAKGAVQLARSKGIKAGVFRPIALWPFPQDALREAAQRAKQILVVEMNAGQMLEDVQRTLGDRKPIHFQGYPGGIVPTIKDICSAVESVHTGKPSSQPTPLATG